MSIVGSPGVLPSLASLSWEEYRVLPRQNRGTRLKSTRVPRLTQRRSPSRPRLSDLTRMSLFAGARPPRHPHWMEGADRNARQAVLTKYSLELPSSPVSIIYHVLLLTTLLSEAGKNRSLSVGGSRRNKSSIYLKNLIYIEEQRSKHQRPSIDIEGICYLDSVTVMQFSPLRALKQLPVSQNMIADFCAKIQSWRPPERL